MPTNAKYKVYNGSSWVEYHFTTNAAQVSQTTGTGFRKFVSANVKVNGVSFSEDSNNNATVTINGSHLNWYNGTKPTTNYLSNASTVQAAIEALDTAAKAAYDNVPSGILTTSNYATTLGSVYQAKDDDLSAIAGLTGTSGFLKKTAANTWSLDTASYVPTTRTVNGKALSGDVTIYSSDIALSSNRPSVTVIEELDEIRSLAWGRNKSRAISYNYTGSYSNIKNSKFNSSDSTITLSGNEVICDDFNNDDVAQYGVSAFRIGDNVYVKELEVPDRWVSNITYGSNDQPTSVEFSILETTKVDLSNYATKATTLAGYGITDANINTTTKVVTLGSNTVSPVTQVNVGSTSYSPSNGVVSLPAYPSTSGLVPYTGATNTVNLGSQMLQTTGKITGNVVASRIATSDTGTIDFQFQKGTEICGKISMANDYSYMLFNAGTASQSTKSYKLKKTGTQEEIATQEWVAEQGYKKIVVGSSFSGTAVAGNIWVDTN